MKLKDAYSWKESYDQPRQPIQNRDITLPTKVHLVKAMVFPMVIYGCESWTVKKAECRRIDAFELWCWRRLLRVSWTARRSNQSIQKEISCGISLEGMMLKLKLQYFSHLMRRFDSLENTLMLGGIGGRRRRGWQRIRCLDGITDSMDVSLSEAWKLVMVGRPGVLWFMGSQRVGHDWETELKLNWADKVIMATKQRVRLISNLTLALAPPSLASSTVKVIAASTPWRKMWPLFTLNPSLQLKILLTCRLYMSVPT